MYYVWKWVKRLRINVKYYKDNLLPIRQFKTPEHSRLKWFLSGNNTPKAK